ncbi:hypothetical protein VaNZ11_003029 [Volvox africanus]|uniref:Transmembrane protein n=1 Tax=Volvox africanus TaxID=51714 RepID=A0ABQ5RT57_9CHLO|nr:hypothetical protein VaNZ11_003029 [Volvox africanus]
MWTLSHFPLLQSSTLPTKKQATVCKCPPKHVTYGSCPVTQHIVRAIGATGATLLFLTSGAFASFASVDHSALSRTSSEHSPTLLVLERRKVEDLVISEFAEGLAEMSDTELVQLLEEILRNRRENSSKPFWKIDDKHAESSFLSAIPSETSVRASTTINAPTSMFQQVDGSLGNSSAPRASDLACARAVEGGESSCPPSSVGTAQVRPAIGGELQASRSTETQFLDASDNVRQQVRASEVSTGVEEVNNSKPIQRSDEGTSYITESEIGRDTCDTSPNSASSTGPCYDTSTSPIPANVQASSDMLEQNWWPAKEWLTGTLFATTPSLQKLCLHSQEYVEGESILQSILPLILDLCESVDTKPTLPLVALMGGVGLVAWLVVGLVQAGAVGSSTAFLRSKLPWVPSLVAKPSAADQDSAIRDSAGTAAPDTSLPILDNLGHGHGNGADTLRSKQQDSSQPSVAGGARVFSDAVSTQGSHARARIADPKLRKLLDNGPPPPQFLGAHAGWWRAAHPGSPWRVGLNGPNVGQMQHVAGAGAQQEDPSWSCDSPSGTLGQKDTESSIVYKAAPPDPWVNPSRGSVTTQQFPSDWQLWQTTSSITEPGSCSSAGKAVSPWDS